MSLSLKRTCATSNEQQETCSYVFAIAIYRMVLVQLHGIHGNSCWWKHSHNYVSSDRTYRVCQWYSHRYSGGQKLLEWVMQESRTDITADCETTRSQFQEEEPYRFMPEYPNRWSIPSAQDWSWRLPSKKWSWPPTAENLNLEEAVRTMSHMLYNFLA